MIPHRIAKIPITVTSATAPSRGRTTRITPRTTVSSPDRPRNHSLEITSRSRTAVAIWVTPTTSAQAAMIHSSASAVTPGHNQATTPARIPARPSSPKTSRPCRGASRAAAAMPTAMAPSTRAYAPQRITRTSKVASGQTIAKIPNSVAATPRCTSSHHRRVSMCSIAHLPVSLASMVDPGAAGRQGETPEWQTAAMRVCLGSDHAGYELKTRLVEFVGALGHEAVDCGPASYDPDDDYPPYCFATAERVVADPGSLGVVVGGSGNGEQIAANVVSVGARMHSPEAACRFVEVFLATPFSQGERHARRIAMLAGYEAEAGNRAAPDRPGADGVPGF